MSTVDTPSLLARLKAAKRLPSSPGTAIRVLELCRRDDVSLDEIADVLMSDPALAGRLLKFVNSPLAGVGREVSSVRDAVLLLGLRTVKLTALGFSLATPDMRPRCPGFDLKRYWSESFATAAVARRLAQHYAGVDREEAFTVALMAGIGRLAIACSIPDQYAKVLEIAPSGEALMQAERVHLGIDNIQFCAELLADWGLPEPLVEAVAYQHQPETATSAGQSLGRILFAARQLAPVFVGGPGLDADARQAARDVVEHTLNLVEDSWKPVAEEILGDYLQTASIFEIEFDNQVCVLDLYAEAQEEATRVGIVAQLENLQTAEQNKDLLRRATTDRLTGIANRAKFDERLDEAIKGVRRGHGHFAMILLDIDYFKKFNDTHGHQVGDLVLKRVARTIENVLRDVDLAARYGGEEFAIISPHTDRKGACVVVARIRKCVDDLRIAVGPLTLRVTISLGLALTVDYEEAPTSEKLIREADEQLYLSKKAGRNTWSYLGRSASQVAEQGRKPQSMAVY